MNHMINSKVGGVEFAVVNTDAQDLHNSLAKKKIHIGKNLTRGLGAGMNPELGRRAAEETKEEIQEMLKGAEMVFIAGGMGGGTCTGAAPVVAKIAREMGALTVGVVTKPFFFEGQQRMRLAEQGLEDLRREVDALIVIPNQRILLTVGQDTTLKSAFAMCDDILRQAVEGISDLITMPGIINVDFNDVKAVMENAGSALMGVGVASGERRAEEAARSAINSPLLEVSIAGAKGVLFAIAGGEDLGMLEVEEAAKVVTESVDPNAKIIFGTIRDDKLKKNEIKVTVIATGFPAPSVPGMGAPRAVRDEVSLFQSDTKPLSEEDEGKIYNSLSSFSFNKKGKKEDGVEEPVPVIEEPPAPESTKVILAEDADGGDEWGSVPSFLKRKR